MYFFLPLLDSFLQNFGGLDGKSPEQFLVDTLSRIVQELLPNVDLQQLTLRDLVDAIKNVANQFGINIDNALKAIFGQYPTHSHSDLLKAMIMRTDSTPM
jgi:hypothetical protein